MSSPKMESGLSDRMTKALDQVQSSYARPTSDHPKTIDLSNAQNEVLRSELVEFCKTTIEDKLTGKAFALPPSDGGDPTLRNALAAFFNGYFNPIHPVKQEHIVLTAGASGALDNAIHAVCDDGDSVIITGPYWNGFVPILKGRANVNVIVAQAPTYQHYDNYLLPSLQAAYDFSTEKSRIKAVLICNPHNPLSICYPKKALVECMEFCQERGLHLIADEIYGLTRLNSIDGVANNSTPFVSLLSLTEPLVPEGAVKIDPSRVHVIWSASKLFGLSGLRVGCFISQQNPQLISAMSMITTSHVNSIASLYLTSLLTWSQLPTLLALNSERLTESYKVLVRAFREWGVEFVTPSDGIFVFAKLAKYARTYKDEAASFERLAKHGVVVAPGRFFHGVETDLGWARIRFSVPVDVMTAAVERIGIFIKSEG